MKKWQIGLLVILFFSVCMAAYEETDSGGSSGGTDLIRMIGQPEKKIIKTFGPLSDTLPMYYGDTVVLFEDGGTKEHAVSIDTGEPGFSAMGVAVGDSAVSLKKLGEPETVNYPVSMTGDGRLDQMNRYWYPDEDVEVSFTFSVSEGITGIKVNQGHYWAEQAAASGLAGEWVNISTGEYVKFFDTGKIAIFDTQMNEIASGGFLMSSEGLLSISCLYIHPDIRMAAMGDCDIDNGQIRCELNAVYQDNITGGLVENKGNNGRLVFELVPAQNGFRKDAKGNPGMS